jgi:hypothetical protein
MPTDNPPDEADSLFDNCMYMKTLYPKHVISDLKMNLSAWCS